MKLVVNEGRSDRLIRAVAAIALAAISFVWLPGAWQMVGYVVAVLLAITAATGFCGLYAVLGVSTCPVSVQTPAPMMQQTPAAPAQPAPMPPAQPQPQEQPSQPNPPASSGLQM